MKHSAISGYAAALTSILIWGTTFIVSKVILEDFRPVEVILIRMILGLVALFLASPRLPRVRTVPEELSYAVAGFCGIVLYFLLENTALTHGLASNVGVIISAAPFFTATLNRIFYRSDRLQVRFFVGFCPRHDGHRPHQLQRGPDADLPSGGPAGPGSGRQLGPLLRAGAAGRRLRPQHP